MSTTYKTLLGDTFASVAVKVYGDDLDSIRIAEANQSVSEPIPEGTELVIPENQDAPENKPQQVSAGADEVGVFIDGQRFRYWEAVSITQTIDSITTSGFTAPFEADNEEFRQIFKPFSFKPLQITVGEDRLFSGTMVNIVPTVQQNRKSVAVSCYSKPGVLSDCTPLINSKLEFNDQSLNEIIASLCLPFGISSNLEAESDPKFERVACSPSKKIMAFLAELAAQRGLIISSTENGRLLVWSAVDKGNPVAILRQGESPLLSVRPNFNPQQYYSVVGITRPVFFGSSNAQAIVKNTHLRNVFRPVTFAANDAKDVEIKTAADSVMGRMFANSVSYTVELSTWRDPSGNLWKPNTTIKVLAPDAMIYSEYEFLIKKVSLKADGDSRTATLELVFVEAYKQPKDPYEGYGITTPEVLPWE